MNKFVKWMFVISLLVTSLALGFSPVQAAGPASDCPPNSPVIGSACRISNGTVYEGDLAIMGGTVTIEDGAIVEGDVALMGGTLDVEGVVEGDIAAFGGMLTLDSTAVIEGNIAANGVQFNRDPDAVVGGDVVLNSASAESWSEVVPWNWDWESRYNESPYFHFMNGVNSLLWNLFQVLGVAALALVLALLMPAPVERLGRAVSRQPVTSGGIGFLAFIAIPAALVLMCITIILIPVALLSLPVIAVAVLVGWIGVGLELGNRLAAVFKTTWATPLAAAIGTLLVSFVSALLALIPCVGWLFGFIIALVGLGAVITTRFGSREATLDPIRRATPPAAPAPVVIPEPSPAYIPEEPVVVEPETPAEEPAPARKRPARKVAAADEPPVEPGQ
ncbi:MAG TPA: polymer-forming cytoskeletal protein [Anaerolineaceae bacterium]|nr:polymer-forming cytoskeletal protein [Anaerolineaceae bacterium]HNS37707.1 polymer-forming cytoskeletal protein [Anaerolineaceae bacterium]HQF61817.1 polymer-forming cytoskeletal protein [Anaerolineaceae bacterium]HQH85304.1 polymer-forming cytoskeletal protein [Anaerolineaceae bacterium]